MRHFIEKMSVPMAWGSILLLLLLVGLVDWLTGSEFSVLPLYFTPVAFAAWRFGVRISICISFASGLTWLISGNLHGRHDLHPYAPYWNSLMRVIFFSIGGLILARLRQQLQAGEVLIGQLQTALQQVKSLEGILPVCPCCGKIRNKQGSWNYLENYLKDNTNVEFMTNTCPDCSAKNNPAAP
jgi:hypothetical protein